MRRISMDREMTTAPRFLREASAVPAPLRAELREAVEPRESRWPALGRLLVAADVLAAGCAGAVAAAIGGAPIGFAAVVVAAWCLVAWLIGLYAGDDLRDWASGLSAMPKLLVTALGLSWPLHALAAWMGAAEPSVAALGAMALTAPLAGLGRTLARASVHRDAAHRQRVVIIGS